MRYIGPAVENGGLTEYYIFLAELIAVLYEFQSAEPHQIDKTRTVGKMGNKPATGTLAHLLEAAYLATQLYMRHAAVNFIYAKKTAAIDISIREIVQ